MADLPREIVEVGINEHRRVTATVDEIRRVRDEWALVIGRFMVAFASCEYWTYLYIYTFGSARLRDAVGDMQLSARTDIAHALLSDIGLTNEMQERVDRAIARIRDLAKTRNMVAHNSPMVHVYKAEKGNKLEVRHELRSARDPGKDITIAALERRYVEAEELDQELALLYGLVRQPKHRVNN